MKILVLGASGMLGHSLLHRFSQSGKHDVYGSVRSKNKLPKAFLEKYGDKLVDGVDVYDFSSVENVIVSVKPDVVVNAIGLIRQKKEVILIIFISMHYCHIKSQKFVKK